MRGGNNNNNNQNRGAPQWNNMATPILRSPGDSLAHRPGDEVPVMQLSGVGKQVPLQQMPATNTGRKKKIAWIVAALVVVAAIAAVVVVFAVKGKNASDANSKSSATDAPSAQQNSTNAGSGSGSAEVDDPKNPKAYPASTCELPNYQSKNGHIVAVAANGTEVPLKMKGINWFGMEASEAVPLGLWDNGVNGTTAFKIAEFLSTNKFNSVRLPLMATYILENTAPNKNLINEQSNRAMNVTSYMSLLKSVIKVLQYRNIGVMLSMHTLTKTDKGALWYNGDVSEEKFLQSIDMLAENLCTNEYWNVMGLDLKNEPSTATWGDNTDKDFRAGAMRIAERMLKGCPSWLGFVEGIYTQHEMMLDGKKYWYFDWFGGGLQGARNQTIQLSVANKFVWAPHYYTPSVFPQAYLYGGGDLGGPDSKGENGLVGYVELEDDALRGRIKATMDDMFGFLASETGPAMVLGEFGGIYASDAHPKKTTKRTTDFTIEVIKQKGWAGGFVWSLNPESEYQYNPADKPGRFFEGVMQTDWINSNPEYLRGLAAMDDMENLQPFPCFPKASS